MMKLSLGKKKLLQEAREKTGEIEKQLNERLEKLHERLEPAIERLKKLKEECPSPEKKSA